MLTDTALRALRARSAPYRVADARGLCIEVTPAGSRLWRYRYRYAGKATMVSLGTYPAVSLAAARRARDDARAVLETGRNPSEQRRADRLALAHSRANTFAALAGEWLEKQAGKWTARHAADVRRSLEADALPMLGRRPVDQVEPAEVIACLDAITRRGAVEVAHRAAQRIAAVFRYAVQTHRAKFNPAADLRGTLPSRTPAHMRALPADELPEFLRRLDAYGGQPETRMALLLALLTFVRTTELRAAAWSEFDMGAAEWRIPAERMKRRLPHVVPLATQTLTTLRALHAITGAGPLLFPSRSNAHRPMSENTMLYAMYRMGYHERATVHGFRGLASTTLNEHGWAPDVIERQLAHQERNKVRAAYNRAQYLPERRKMMQAWADWIDTQRDPASNVVHLHRKA